MAEIAMAELAKLMGGIQVFSFHWILQIKVFERNVSQRQYSNWWHCLYREFIMVWSTVLPAVKDAYQLSCAKKLNILRSKETLVMEWKLYRPKLAWVSVM